MITQINQSLSDFKKEVALAKFLNSRDSYQDKSVWRILLRQYRKENGQYPLVYDTTGNATVKSLVKFEKIMDIFSNRMVFVHEILTLEDQSAVIPLCYKSGIANVYIWLRKV